MRVSCDGQAGDARMVPTRWLPQVRLETQLLKPILQLDDEVRRGASGDPELVGDFLLQNPSESGIPTWPFVDGTTDELPSRPSNAESCPVDDA